MSFPITKQPLILIVDDEATNITLLKDILEKDFKIIATKKPQKAIDLAKKFPLRNHFYRNFNFPIDLNKFFFIYKWKKHIKLSSFSNCTFNFYCT